MKSKKVILGIYFFILFIYSAVSSTRFSISESAPNIIYAAFPAVLSLIVALIFRINLFSRKFFVPLGVFLLWAILLKLTQGRGLSPYPLLVLICTFVSYKCFRKDFFKRFVNVTVSLSLLSLFVYFIALIAYPVVMDIAETIGEPAMNVSYSLYVVNVDIKSGFLRNPGFCWEPGRFACFLVVAISIILMKYGFSLKNKKLIILIISLITTLSTTGFAAFLFIIVYYIFRKHKFNLLYVLIACVMVLGFMSLPFMKDKIVELWVNENIMNDKLNDLKWRSQNDSSGDYYCPQRFQAFALQLMNVRFTPWLTGEGRNLDNHYINRDLGFRVSISEGNLGIIVQYGYVLGLVLYFFMGWSCWQISKRLRGTRKPWLLLLWVWLIINFSYSFWECPLLATIWMWSVFSNEKLHINTKRKKRLKLKKAAV